MGPLHYRRIKKCNKKSKKIKKIAQNVGIWPK